jgi:lipoprotein-anchoring transpeptidase ErfK/SrfK
MRDDHGLSVEMRVAGLAAALALLATGCGARSEAAVTTAPRTASTAPTAVAAKVRRCAPTSERKLGSARVAYAGVAPSGAVAYRSPGRAVLARFGATNANDYPTVFGVLGKVVGANCRARWYRVQLPIKPNGAVGYVRASALTVEAVRARIEVDVSARRLTLFRAGKRVLQATVAVGSPSTPTPIGRYYVNQRLIPADTRGPFGPAAIGVSAFSNVLTGWAQGGPIAIHGTNEPWSIGHPVSNGCVRLPNGTLERVFRSAVAGTPVIIHP